MVCNKQYAVSFLLILPSPLFLQAAGVAIETIKGHCGSLKEVHFVLFGDETFEAFDEVASRLLDEVSEKDGGPEGAEEGAEGGKKKETCEVQ